MPHPGEEPRPPVLRAAGAIPPGLAGAETAALHGLNVLNTEDGYGKATSCGPAERQPLPRAGHRPGEERGRQTGRGGILHHGPQRELPEPGLCPYGGRHPHGGP